MMTEPVVSVVTIFWNEARFITDAIESVIAQTYPSWELLLVDDGSDDSSSDIARRYASSRTGQIRYLEHPHHANLGMSAARNLAYVNSRGPISRISRCRRRLASAQACAPGSSSYS